MTRITLTAFIIIALAPAALAQGTALPLPNPGFEEGLEGWEISASPEMISVSQEEAASGTSSLKIVDAVDGASARIYATALAIEAPGVFEIRGKFFPVCGTGLGVYHDFLDAAGKILNDERHLQGLGGSERCWMTFSLRTTAPPGAVALRLYFHSYSAALVTAYVDDLEIVALGESAMRPPWEGQYTIDASETERLTAADVVGPDGIVYPNWSRAGVQGGIPEVPVVARIEDFGAVPDDDADDSVALHAACRAAGEQGGGAVLLGAGTWHLDRPVTVRADGVVIRGLGAERTRVIFRYGLGEEGIRFFSPEPGATVGPNTRLELHALPTGLETMLIRIGEVELGTWTRGAHSGNTFAFTRTAAQVMGQLRPGAATLTGIATYQDGSARAVEVPIVIDPEFRADPPAPNSQVAIDFRGQGWSGSKLLLAQDGQRGATQLVLQDAGDLAPGDVVLIDAPATERWKALTRNACAWGTYRRYLVQVTAVEGNTITLDQPLRIEFPVIDGSYVQRFVPIRRCGLEDLYLEQTENLWITSAQFSNAWDCWARGVTVRMCGRHPVYGSLAKFCEIRNCVFDDAWFKGGGGTAYGGWEHSFDCLMDGIETLALRHAPLYQWAASGCVIRNGVFHDSDGQWHSGWTNENLFENCVITSVTGNGGYGYGFWASPPEDTAHGPNGPRNVAWNCDLRSEKAGVWMGGMNEGWIFAYNRFVAATGPGVDAKDASFDHIIRGNVFVLRDGASPMVRLRTPDCIGVRVLDNALYGGNGQFVGGLGEPALVEGNTAYPLLEGDALPPRPTPPVPSIFEWQRENL